MNNKLKLRIIIPVCAIVLLLGGTYAWYAWQTSSDEETIIATDTGYAKVFFDGGDDITGKLKPVLDKSKGMSKQITVSADKAFIEPITFNLYLDINSIDEGLKHESFKFELYKDGTKIKEGNFSDSYLTSALSDCSKNDGAKHITLVQDTVTTTEAVYTLYTWIDGTMSNPLSMEGKNFNFTLHADGQHAILGEGNKGGNDDETVFPVHNGVIPEGGVYIRGAIPGVGHDMTNATTYVAGQPFPETVEHGDIYQYGDYEYVSGYEYDHYLETEAEEPYLYEYWQETEEDSWGVRVLDRTKTSYGNILNSINKKTVSILNATFKGCENLINAPVLPESVIQMNSTFEDCTNLVNAPAIPGTVTDMTSTFKDCKSLVNAPVLPASITKMYETFRGCISLKNAPVIPNSVINMGETFKECTSLENAPVIPNSVTDMNSTFYGCTSLTGTVRFETLKLDDIERIFNGTSLPITVEVPEGSDIYNQFINYEELTEYIWPHNVTITTYVKE